MKLHELKPDAGSKKKPKRVGRGIGSGGPKGPAFEGGQMPLQRRIPKRGFKNRFALEFAILNLKDIDALEGMDVITPEALLKKGIIKDVKCGLKILGEGDIQRPVTIRADAFSASALAKIAAAGGKAEVI